MRLVLAIPETRCPVVASREHCRAVRAERNAARRRRRARRARLARRPLSAFDTRADCVVAPRDDEVAVRAERDGADDALVSDDRGQEIARAHVPDPTGAVGARRREPRSSGLNAASSTAPRCPFSSCRSRPSRARQIRAVSLAPVVASSRLPAPLNSALVTVPPWSKRPDETSGRGVVEPSDPVVADDDETCPSRLNDTRRSRAWASESRRTWSPSGSQSGRSSLHPSATRATDSGDGHAADRSSRDGT